MFGIPKFSYRYLKPYWEILSYQSSYIKILRFSLIKEDKSNPIQEYSIPRMLIPYKGKKLDFS